MAHTNSTPNYALPQFITTDKPAWLTDVNQAYSAIDTALKAASDAASSAQTDATQALSDAATAGTTATSADSKGSGCIASLAPQFDTTATYIAGDRVIYNNLLYVCTVDVSFPGPWTGSANWNRDTVSNAITTDISNISVTDLSDVTGTPEAGDHMEWIDDSGSLKLSSVAPNLNVSAAAWSATASSSFGTALTGSINLTKGIYLVIAAYPLSSESKFLSDIEGQNISKWGGAYFNLGSQENAVRFVRANDDTQIRLISAASSSVTFSYTERGGLFAYKLA